MKKDEIKIGGHYIAKVAGNLTTVRVDAIRNTTPAGAVYSARYNVYDVINLATGRKTKFRSAAKFRSEVKPRNVIANMAGDTPPQQLTPAAQPIETLEDEQSSDPTISPRTNSTPNTASVVGASPLSLASRIASTRHKRHVGASVAGMIPNKEQEAIIAAAVELFESVRLCYQDGQLCLVVMAGAGSGKTATCKMLEEVLSGRGQYTAFNRPLVDDARPKFKKAKCSTTHQLAFHATGKQYQHRLNANRIPSYEVARILGIEDYLVPTDIPLEPDSNEWAEAAVKAGYTTKESAPEDFRPVKMKRLRASFLAGQVMMAVKRFCQSSDREITENHIRYIDGIDTVDLVTGERSYANNTAVKQYLLPFCLKAWTDLTQLDGRLRFEHDHYVKLWQLGTGNDRPVIAADYILLDEYQDTAPVFLDILMQQKHALLVMVGDDNQRIYEWRGAVNAGDYFPDAPRCMLSQSYRFGQAVADVANSILATLEEPTQLRMMGNPDIPSRVVNSEGDLVDPRCYLYRTNAGALERVMAAISENRTPYLCGGPTYIRDLVAWCQAAIDLKCGKGTMHSELGCFTTWDEVVTYSKTDEGADLRLMVKLIETFTAETIRDALKCMPAKEDYADVIICTAHKSKGREWDTVCLGSDFPLANKMTDSDRRLLYVAATRAKYTLDISMCPPFCGGEDYTEKKWVPGLSITYTQPMPTIKDQAAWLTTKELKAQTIPSAKPPVDVKPGTDSNRNFTWTNFAGAWCIRGPNGAKPGEQVTVSRRDGVTSTETIRRVVRQFDDATIYGL